MREDLYAPPVILIADDDLDDRMMIDRVLRESRLRNPTRLVEDGVELMDYLYRRGPYADRKRSPRPGLILLDLNMPRKSGLEALEEIKSDPALQRIPVIVLTTSGATSDIQESYDRGANAYVSKPISYAELVKTITGMQEFWLRIVQLPRR